jgi:hypothetical protein
LEYLVCKTLSLLSELLNNWRLSDVEIQGWNGARLLEQRVPKMTQIFAWGSSMKIIKVIIMTIIVSWLAFKNLLAWIQSHYRKVPRWELFMEQELRFGLDLGRMADFPAFIASKSFDLWNHHIPQKCLYNLWHILTYIKIYEILKKHFKFFKG